VGIIIAQADFHATWEARYFLHDQTEMLEGILGFISIKLDQASSEKDPGYDPNIRTTETKTSEVVTSQ